MRTHEVRDIDNRSAVDIVPALEARIEALKRRVDALLVENAALRKQLDPDPSRVYREMRGE